MCHDGHITEPDPVRRTALCVEAWKPVEALRAMVAEASPPLGAGVPLFALLEKSAGGFAPHQAPPHDWHFVC